MAKLKLKKTEYSRFKKRRRGARRRLLFCTDEGLGPVADHVATLGHLAIAAEEAPVNTADDMAFLGWMREKGLIFVTRDWRRAKQLRRDGLLHDRPGIVVIHSPGGTIADLIDGIDTFLGMGLSYGELWETVIYLSQGAVKALFADGSQIRLT